MNSCSAFVRGLSIVIFCLAVSAPGFSDGPSPSAVFVVSDSGEITAENLGSVSARVEISGESIVVYAAKDPVQTLDSSNAGFSVLKWNGNAFTPI